MRSRQSKDATRPPLPDNMDSPAVIEILVRMIEFPSASAASISRALQRKGVSVTAGNVRSVVEFYSLEKKNGSLKVAELVNCLRDDFMGKISDISALPDDAEYVFESCVDNSIVQKRGAGPLSV